MSIIKDVKTTNRESKIDDAVIADAYNDKVWGKKIEVNPRLKPTSIRLSTRTIERAKFFARVHKERGYQSWLKKVIEERINTEYELYKRLKKEVV